MRSSIIRSPLLFTGPSSTKLRLVLFLLCIFLTICITFSSPSVHIPELSGPTLHTDDVPISHIPDPVPPDPIPPPKPLDDEPTPTKPLPPPPFPVKKPIPKPIEPDDTLETEDQQTDPDLIIEPDELPDGELSPSHDHSHNSLPPGKLSLRGGQIDAVIMYVNGSDETWISQRKARLQRLGHAFSENFQWTDNNELLWCLRGVYYNIPQLRHVWLVVASPSQVPHWLDVNNPYISVVYHSDIFPSRLHLPTFSSYAIEANLWRIKGLSEDFIYLNDDFFIINQIPDNLLRDSDGFAQIHIDSTKINKPINQYRRGLINAGRILTRRFGRPKSINAWFALTHTFYVCNRKIMNETASEFPKAYLDLIKHPFRTPSGLPHFIFLANHYWTQKSIETNYAGIYKAKYHSCDSDEYVYWNFDAKHTERNEKYFQRAWESGAVSMCINDSSGDRSVEQSQWVESWLLRWLPQKAGWER
ncbi:hypothetical protein RCL1_000991 [Eukaryota sp. TZLM3-RCL]